MNCKIPFTEEFIISVLGITFIRKERRISRENFLFNMQLLLEAATMPYMKLLNTKKEWEQSLKG